MRITPTQKLVRILFDYDESSGFLYWKPRSEVWADLGLINLHDIKTFNGSYIGKRVGTPTHRGYRTVTVLNKRQLEHRIIWLWMTGEFPEQVDHINGITDDNRWENLRNVSHFENMKNKSISKKNTSGYSGINKREGYERWRVRINVSKGKRKHIGDYPSFEEAFIARKKAEKDYDYHDNHGRPIAA